MGNLHCQFVAAGSETKQTTVRNVTEITAVAKLLSRKRVAEMNLYKRYANREHRVAKRYAGMRKRARVENNEIHAVVAGLLHAINEFMLRIALETFELVTAILGEPRASFLNVCQSCRTIDLWFAGTEQIEVRAV